MVIQEAHPLKQGLKPKAIDISTIPKTHSRGTSIKTRIETFRPPLTPQSVPYSRGTSIKTRIETPIFRSSIRGDSRIQEAHPLKQGLKPLSNHYVNSRIQIQEAHPLKQGLKQIYDTLEYPDVENSRGTSIKTRIETRSWTNIVPFFQIQEAHPLKQGLKLSGTTISAEYFSEFKRHIH